MNNIENVDIETRTTKLSDIVFKDDMVKRTVRDGRTSGMVSIPKAWIGKYVIVCLLDEEQQQAARRTDE